MGPTRLRASNADLRKYKIINATLSNGPNETLRASDADLKKYNITIASFTSGPNKTEGEQS